MDKKINELLTRARANRLLPGAVVGYMVNGQRSTVAVGHHTYDADSPPVNAHTVYDAASITKSVPLSLLVHKALAEGKLMLTTRMVEVLPDFTGQHHEHVTVWHLLTYTAVWDMPDGLSAYTGRGAEAVLRALRTCDLKAPPGTTYFYTNPPAIVLGLMLEKVYGKPFFELAQQQVLIPLAMSSSTFDATQLPDEVVAPTEVVDGHTIHKVVHDESARVLQEAGYQPANAGLFTTVEDLLNSCEMILQNGAFAGKKFLSADAVQTLRTNQLADIDERSGLGWEMDETVFGGNYRNPYFIGKTGFTGCLVAIDTAQDIAFVMLSNAKYPDRSTTRQQLVRLRSELAQIVFGDR